MSREASLDSRSRGSTALTGIGVHGLTCQGDLELLPDI